MPPNFLVLMADQLTASVLPAYGGRARTPHIDALAAARRRVRILLLQQSAVCAVALFLHGGAVAFEHRRLRQCRGVPSADAHLRPLPAERGLPDDAERQDAFLRPRPAARFRGAPHHRHLSGGFRLDPGLDALRGTAGLVPHHGLRDPSGLVRTHQPDRLRRRGDRRRPPETVRHGAQPGPAAVLPGGVDDASARSVRRSAAVLGSLR